VISAPKEYTKTLLAVALSTPLALHPLAWQSATLFHEWMLYEATLATVCSAPSICMCLLFPGQT
jgi:hypothetical protein